MFRLLTEKDRMSLDRFLTERLESSMFLRANVFAGGIEYEGRSNQAQYMAEVVGNEVRGVASHDWRDRLLLQAPENTGELTRALIAATGRPVREISGPTSQVQEARESLGLYLIRATELEEDLFSLDIWLLQTPESLTIPTLRVRHSVEADLPLLSEWRVQYEIEAVRRIESAELRKACRQTIEGLHAQKRLSILSESDRPVAMSAFNASVPDCVQVGGVFTPPDLRKRGYARCVVAGSLLEARKHGVGRAVLFTDSDNEPARRAYKALGFTVVGNYSLVLFDTPQAPQSMRSPQSLMAAGDQNYHLVSERLVLTPLSIADARPLFMLLQEPSLYVFTKGSPPADIAELSRRIESWQSRKSPAGDEIWLNWSMRLHSTDTVIGHVQASITDERADLAWVVGIPFQGRGYATEAARAVATWIRATFPGRELRANIHSEHRASQRVARNLGLEPSAEITSEGEIVWKAIVPEGVIRRMSPQELQMVVDVWHTTKKVAYPYLPLEQARTREDDLNFFREKLLPECDVWVAEKAGQLVGFLAIRQTYLDRLYVLPEFQRHGIGTALLAQAKQLSPVGLELHTHQKNTSARAFYEKHGFTVVSFGVSPAPESEPDVMYQWRP